jgi:hypothetical protein
MKKSHLFGSFALAVVLSAVAHGTASAQLGVAARVGTLGLGVEGAFGLSERFVVRGGMGLMPVEPSLTVSDLDVTLELPTWYNVGIDLYLNGAIRIGGGLLFKADDPTLRGTFTTDQDIGGQTYTPQEIGTLIAVIDSPGQIPYALIGFGRHTAPGIGLFLDLGVAFQKEPDFLLSTEGGTLNDDSGPFRDALDAEAAQFEEDAGSYLKFWPIVSLGLRVGI